ncbi:MAG: sigma-70 family RNA polymerase sigma factor [Planctomycetales bacterium]|nr:sigma-70 family RNA polymerase sigma factor [Planctomycetales bacterium]
MSGSFDKHWRRQALAGDGPAVARLAAEMLEPLYRFCYYRVGRDRHLCEEVVQETLVQAIRKLEQYEPDRSRGDLFPWLAGLARNEIQRVLARRHDSVSLEAMWAAMDQRLARVYAALDRELIEEDVLRCEETRQMVNATMSQLPSHYREALELKYVAGHSVRQIATARAMTEKAVESLLTRARQAFRETFLTLSQSLDST